ncbi:MAG: response regulator transcription factor [Leptospiraceae bacterium]|nr:response regulator transcription factor [Leptospiraceae bacterium]
MESFEIILADDHAVILEGVKAILKSHSRLKVKGDFSNAKSLLEFLSKDKADLILLDIDIPGADKLNLLKKIKLRHPQTKVVIFTMHKGMNYFLEAKKIGADSYVLKSDLISFLPTILLKALKGEFYCSDELKQLLTKEYNKEIIKPKELEILSFIAQGMKYADISKQIGKSEKTIEYYVYKLRKKYDVKNNVDLLLKLSNEIILKEE